MDILGTIAGLNGEKIAADRPREPSPLSYPQRRGIATYRSLLANVLHRPCRGPFR